MRVMVRLTGRYKNLIGLESTIVDTINGDTVWHVIDALVEKYQVLGKDKNRMIILRNGVHVNREEKIKNNDELTILPPVVSGG
jgi:molybdopterin converting factor small subunit